MNDFFDQLIVREKKTEKVKTEKEQETRPEERNRQKKRQWVKVVNFDKSYTRQT